MSKIVTAIIALAILSAAAAPSYAFETKKFWTMQNDSQR